MNLILDTNILHQESLASHNMQMLRRLSLSGFVTVHVPSLVRREFIERVVQDSISAIQSATSSLEKVSKKISKASRANIPTQAAIAQVSELVRQVEDTFYGDFDLWAASGQIKIVEYDHSLTSAVMEAYFSGGAPFRAKRSREDIIDAMIMTSIDALLAEHGQVVVVIKDGTFRQHLLQKEHVSIVDSLGEFLGRENCRSEIARLDSQSNIEEFKSAFSDTHVQHSLIAHIMASKAILDTIYIEDEVSGVQQLEIDCFGLRINGPEIGDVLSIRFGDVDYLGPGEFSIKFKMDCFVKLDYCASYGDYLDLSYEREKAVEMTSMNNVGICDLEERKKVRISGQLHLNIGAQTGVELVWDQQTEGTFPSEVFFIEFEAETAEILPND